MKSVRQLNDLLKSLVLSGFILLFLSGGAGKNDRSILSTDLQGASHLSIATTDLYSLTTDTERFFENIQRIPSSPSKISFGDYLSVVNLTESKRSHLLTKDIILARYRELLFQSHDIAFPFHSFW
ncbi:MAG: hypothetical protein WAU36_11435 [Cyclobacteriaceae bacterium]